MSYNRNRGWYASTTSSCYFGTLPFNQRTSKFLSSITVPGPEAASALFCYSIYSLSSKNIFMEILNSLLPFHIHLLLSDYAYALQHTEAIIFVL